MNNQNRFVIYENDDQFDFDQNDKKINIKFNRIAFIFFIFFIISIIYSIHLIHLGSRGFNSENSDLNKIYNKLKRADIVDRNGNFLAKTVSSIDIGINPVEIIDQKKLLLNLGIIFPNKDYQLIKSKFDNNKFFWFEKKISDTNYEKLMLLGDKSIKPEEKLTRVYPQKNLFSHIIGQIDDDNNGISGLEKSLDEKLKKNKDIIQLSLDKNIKFLIREELLKYNQILATKGVYEFGSVFKTFTMAAAFNEKIFEPESEFINLPKSITCAGFPISEYNKDIPSNLTLEQILVRSGNIGSVRIGQKIGEEKFRSFLQKIGITGSINFDIEEVGVPIKFNWGKCPL